MFDLTYKVPLVLSITTLICWEPISQPLTTIKHLKKEMGRVAMKLLLDLMSNKRIKEKRIFLETSLIERSTVQI